jgi:hypothetical protein
MCSTPKGGSNSKPLLSSNVDSTSGGMSSAEYSNMVLRANESYERRQEELKEYRKTHKNKLSQNNLKPAESTFWEKIKVYFSQNGSTEQIQGK